MHSSDLARQILADMWEFGRILLIVGCVSVMWGGWIARYEGDNERRSLQGGLLCFALGTVGSFVLFSFLNVEFGNLVSLMHASPAWGSFTGLVALLVCGFVLMIAYKRLVASRKAAPLSILETAEELPGLYTRNIQWILMVLALLMLASIFWLWRIAQ